MKRALKIVVIVLAIAFLAIQFYRPSQMNPAIVQAENLEATVEVPENVQAILKRSCNDCHSNQTVYPWYSNVAPFSWLLANHIEEGRRELNFDVWNTYNAKRKSHKLEDICEQITMGEMPHNQYLWIHRDANLSEEDKILLCRWTETTRQNIKE